MDSGQKNLIEPIMLGKIGSCYGIRGWLRIFSFTEKREGIFDYQPWFIKITSKWQEFNLEDWRHYNRNIIVKFNSIHDRNSASMLTNCKVFIDSSQLPQLDEGIYYYKDLIGCKVFTTKGLNLGEVIEVVEIGSNDILVIKANISDIFNTKKLMIPFLYERIIKNVNLVTKIIKINWNFTS